MPRNVRRWLGREDAPLLLPYRPAPRVWRWGVTDKDRATWRASTPIDWAASPSRSQVGYCVRAGTGCWYHEDNERLDEGQPTRTIEIDRTYIETHAPTVREQLVKAGVRLAGLLNQALGH